MNLPEMTEYREQGKSSACSPRKDQKTDGAPEQGNSPEPQGAVKNKHEKKNVGRYKNQQAFFFILYNFFKRCGKHRWTRVVRRCITP
jgi:hypothetical protein